jgi:hypothetical protein
MLKYPGLIRPLVIAFLLLTVSVAHAQNLLNKTITLQVKEQRLGDVLEIISNSGNFFFSYNSNIIKRDSLITASLTNSSVKQVLTVILGNEFEFRESGNYIILRRAPIRIRLVTSSAVSENKFYTISGYVIDDQTGERISDASVYEKQRLSIATTNLNGYFKIKLKSKYKTASISVSKEFYQDTTVEIEPRFNQSVTITLVPLNISEKTVIIAPDGYEAPESINLEIPVNDSISWLYRYEKKDFFLVEKTGMGRWLLSSKQKIQSINLKKFFVVRPYQASVIPGVSTNGKLNSQVINNFSLNVLGGYSGGTNGFELGGLFNIDKKDVRYVQAGGLFNIVGGSLTGLQVGGVTNTVLDSLKGLQIGGVNNYVKNKFSGLQLGGVYNHIGATLDGVQIAGVTNFTNHKTRGVQIAGVANISSREVKGAQIAGVFNYTRRLKGLQIGLINVSDTSEGYSIGLINIVVKGYHKLSLYTNESIDLNAAFKTGNSKLYSILLGGYNSVPDQKVWSFGYGLGSELISGKKFSLNTEATSQHLYLGSWDYYNILNRLNLQLNFKLGKYFSIYGGPSYSVFLSDQDVHFAGYKQTIPPSGYKTNKLGNRVNGWFGWTAGVNIF